MLRELNISLSEIQSFMKHRSAQSLNTLLNEKIIELNHTISHLKSIQDILSNYKQDITDLMNIDVNQISLIQKSGNYLACVQSSPNVSFEKEMKFIISEARKYQVDRLFDISYGSMISTDKIIHNQCDNYDALFIEVPHPKQIQGLHLQPSGLYLRAFSKGSLG